MPAFTDLFGPTTLPPDGYLEVDTASGSAEAAVLAFDNVTGDPVYRTADIQSSYVLPFTFCRLAHGIVGIAFGSRLDHPPWSTTGADSVDIAGAGSGLRPTGSLNVQLAGASTTFTLNAQNSCGSQASAVMVTLGPPAMGTVQIISGNTPAAAGTQILSGAPGQLISVQVNNVSDPSLVTNLLLTAPDGTLNPITPLGVGPAGDVQAYVLWVDENTVNGHKSGAMMLSAVSNGMVSDTVPFTLLPLTYSGDPVADFGTYWSNFLATWTPLTTAVSPDIDLSAVQKLQNNALTQMDTAIQAMLSSISLTGSASFQSPYDDPSVPGATVTKDDLAGYLAFTNMLATANSAAGSVVAESRAAQSLVPKTSAGGTCIADKIPSVHFPLLGNIANLIGFCKFTEQAKAANPDS